MHKHLQSLLLVAVITFTYLWLQIHMLEQYALQAFAGAILIYFISKRLKQAKFWHVMPEDTSVEMILLTFAFLLLIGATGNLESYFYPLTYLHLFLLVMTTNVSTAIIATLSVMIFHYALTPTLGGLEVGALLAFPLLLLFFLFAKRQYKEVQLEKEIIQAEKKEIKTIEESAAALEHFIEVFLKPKIQVLNSLLEEEEPDPAIIKNQLSLMESESTKIVERAKKSNHSAKKAVEIALQQDHDPET